LTHIARAIAGKVSIEAARDQPVLTVS